MVIKGKNLKKAVKVLTGSRYGRLHAVKFGIAGGVMTGLSVLILTLIGALGYANLWIALINNIYGLFGYNPGTFFGIILGVVYGFIDGFLLTWVFAIIYNKLL